MTGKPYKNRDTEELKREFLSLCQKYTQRRKVLSAKDSLKAAKIASELERRKQERTNQ